MYILLTPANNPHLRGFAVLEDRYFMFGKYNGFVSKARVSACMYFLVWE
jgi:hypothetical protein